MPPQESVRQLTKCRELSLLLPFLLADGDL